ncbi:tRNA (guanine-N(7)-)-methyltransferase non-catalytic subunit WDR4 [Homalodisca vitripennis]|uniref:tRNA (guanine-N(7)-)-methyltransferase non-catalytic subunit WDR4 n=1 Tax=Homalodisca vitripennis TaxID=197043 RepID=UPI001EEAB6A3|nr:tRNA (guanine-N(7)-)-methyltransferase non-catalytic subunit WDR4 [Homalodisca vitripennis]
MACLSSNSEFVSLTCGVKTYLVRLSDSDLFSINHSDIQGKDTSKGKATQSNCDKKHGICGDIDDIGLCLLCSDISPCGNFLAFSTYAKHLCVMNITNSKFIVTNVYNLARGASKIKFTPTSKKIVVADKSGDVYLFDPNEENNEGQLILGHLSLLLDVLVSPNEQLIITCDRDEKIRVSSFPNGYNIVAYCLGHTEFVSSVLFLPHNMNYLVSTSGDGTVRFWDYKCGKELMVCNTFVDIQSLEKADSDDQLVEDLSVITDAAAVFLDSTTSIVCVCLENFKICLVLKCTSESESLHYTISQKICVEDINPWKITINSDIMWMVNCSDIVKVKALTYNPKSGCFENTVLEHISKTVDLLNSKKLIIDSKRNIVNLLFKKTFENVQEYLKRKELRSALHESSNKKIRK